MRIRAVATQDAVRSERKEIAALNRGRPFVGNGVRIGQPVVGRGLDVGEDLAQFLLGPEMRTDLGGLLLEVVKALGPSRDQSVGNFKLSVWSKSWACAVLFGSPRYRSCTEPLLPDAKTI